MRKLEVVSLALILALTCVSANEAAVPQLMNYQGILRTSTGAAVADGSHNVTFRLYGAETGGTLLWEETRTVVTDSGLFTVLLGSLAPMNEYHFTGDAYLGIEIEADGELTPRTRIASVGYAFQAANSDLLDGYDASQLMSSPPGATVFRAQLAVNGGSPAPFPLPAGTRHITSIIGSADGVNELRFLVGPTEILRAGVGPAPGEVFIWNAGDGAPLLIGPAESFDANLRLSGSGWVVLTGYAF